MFASVVGRTSSGNSAFIDWRCRSGTSHRHWLKHSDRRRDRPNPVDTYRPADIEKLGIRNATDLTTFLPQQAGGTDTGWNCLLIIGDRQAGVRCREAASVSDIRRGAAVIGNFVTTIRCFYRIPADCYSVEHQRFFTFRSNCHGSRTNHLVQQRDNDRSRSAEK